MSCARADGLGRASGDWGTFFLKLNCSSRSDGTHGRRINHRLPNRRRIQRRRDRCRNGFLVDCLSQTRRRRGSIISITGVNRCDPVTSSGKTGRGARRRAGAYNLRDTARDRHSSLFEFNCSRPHCGTERSCVGHRFANRRRAQRRRQRQRSGFLVDRLAQTRRRCRGNVIAIARINGCHQPPAWRRIGHSALRPADADGLRSTTGDRHPRLPEFNRTCRRAGIERSRVSHRFANRRRIQRRRQRHRRSFSVDRLAHAGRRCRSSVITIARVNGRHQQPARRRASHSAQRPANADGLRSTTGDHHPRLPEFNRTCRRAGIERSRVSHRFANRRRIQRRRQRHRRSFLVDRLAQTRRRCRGHIITIARVNGRHQQPARRRASHSAQRPANADGLRSTTGDHHPRLPEFNRTCRRAGIERSRVSHRFANRRRIQRRRQRHRRSFSVDRLAHAGRRCRSSVITIARVNGRHQPPTRRRASHNTLRTASAHGLRRTPSDRHPGLLEVNSPRRLRRTHGRRKSHGLPDRRGVRGGGKRRRSR